MYYKKKFLETLEKVLELNKKLDFFIEENAELKEKLAVFSGKKKKTDALCKGCVHLIEGKTRDGLWLTDVSECELNRTCKDFEKGDSDENNGD